MMIDITQLANAVIVVVVALISAYIIPILKKMIGDDKLKQIAEFIPVFVAAAEQLYDKEQTVEKKEYVQNLIKTKLAKLNITIDENELDAQIEAAVLQLHNELV